MYVVRIAKSLKGLCLINALLLLFLFNAPNTFADFYVIAGSRGIGTAIRSLPYSITSSGFYYITKDLSCAPGYHGIVIEADNVTLDLMGFSLVGAGGTGSNDGIFMNIRTNVEIRNGSIRNFSRNGIFEFSSGDDGSGHRVINIRAKENGYMGINLRGKGHKVEKCTATNNINSGIYSGPGSIIIGNTCNNNGNHGIGVVYPNEYDQVGSILQDNICFFNSKDGIATSFGFNIIGNVCNNNTENGITTGEGSIVNRNTCHNNFLSGIGAGAGTTVTGNTCFSNKDGIAAGIGSTIIGNTCRTNAGYGIKSDGESFVDQNTSTNNVGGIDCTNCTGQNHSP